MRFIFTGVIFLFYWLLLLEALPLLAAFHLPLKKCKYPPEGQIKVYLLLLSQQEAAKATEQPDTSTTAAEPDPAEVWKKDFQCQWYKTADGDVSDQQSPKDGASAGETAAEGAGDGIGITGTTSTVASETESTGRRSPGTGSPKPSPEATAGSGAKPISAPKATVLLSLFAAGRLCLEP